MRTTTTLLGLLALALATATPANAQSGIQITPDGKRSLINRDLGDERWAISYDFDDRTVTGNVFFRDGRPPAFVWCERVSDDGNPDPGTVEITFSCSGAQSCRTTACAAADWTVINPAVTLPGAFLVPPPASEGSDRVPTTTEELFAYLVRADYRALEHESSVHPSAGPHGGSVLSYVNSILGASLGSGATAHPIGAASIKELYSGDQRTLTGWAVSVKTAVESAGGQGWYWREFFSTSDPTQSIGGQGSSACVGCHAAGLDYVLIPYPLQ